MRITRKNRPNLDFGKLRYPLRFVTMLWLTYAMVLMNLLTAPAVAVSSYDKILRAASDAVLPLGGTFVLACRLREKDTDPVRYFDRCAKLYAVTVLVTTPLSYAVADQAVSDLLLYTGSYAISGVICSVLLRAVMVAYGP